MKEKVYCEAAAKVIPLRGGDVLSMNAKPGNVEVITTIGDSMEPTLRAGDMAVVDVSIDRIIDESVYFLSVDNMMLIKRVRWMPDGGVMLASDNPTHKDVALTRDHLKNLRVIGRLVCSVRKF